MSFLNQPFTLLDGGMGQELVKRAKNPLTPLWSADVLRDHLDLVVDVHRDFIQAGADVITLSSYAATPDPDARTLALEATTTLVQSMVGVSNATYL